MNNVKLNKVYPIFDNGVIEKSRRNYVKIVKIERFSDADDQIKHQWSNHCNISPYADKTDFFVYGVDFTNRRVYIFARTRDGGYFSFNDFMFDSRLDVDGSLNAELD